MKYRKMAQDLKDQLKQAALLLRFRTSSPTSKSRRYLSFKAIASTLKLTPNEVQYLCRKALKPPKALTIKKKARILDQEHLDFLLSRKTLEQWAGFTLQKRAKLFHRRFTDKRIAVTSLRRLYIKNGIKRKKVRQEKNMSEKVQRDFVQLCVNLLHELNTVKAQGLPIIYLDEILFGKRSIAQKEWASKNSNLTVLQKEVCTGYRNVIASMTEDGGIFHVHIQTDPCDRFDFIYYLHMVSQKLNRKPFALFMDNAGIHRPEEVRDTYKELKITPVFNVGYSPEFNPIEAVFSKVKRLFNLQRLNNLVNKSGFNFDRVIKSSFNSITAQHCGACVRKSMFLLQESCTFD